jgi:hypothetical protein
MARSVSLRKQDKDRSQSENKVKEEPKKENKEVEDGSRVDPIKGFEVGTNGRENGVAVEE